MNGHVAARALGIRVRGGQAVGVRPARAAVMMLLLMILAPVPSLWSPADALGVNPDPQGPASDNVLRFHAQELGITYQADGSSGVPGPNAFTVWRGGAGFTPTNDGSCTGLDQEDCLAFRLQNIRALTSGARSPIDTSSPGAISTSDFVGISSADNASVAANFSAFNVTFPASGLTNLRATVNVQGWSTSAGTVTGWYLIYDAGGVVQHISQAFSATCGPTSPARIPHSLSVSFARIPDAAAIELRVNKTLCTAAAGSLLMDWQNLAAWSTDTLDLANSRKEQWFGDFIAAQEGARTLSGPAVNLTTLSNVTATFSGSSTSVLYLAGTCAGSAGNCLRTSGKDIFPSGYLTGFAPCLSVTYRGAAGANDRYIAMFEVANSCTYAVSHTMSGTIPATGQGAYFLDHDVYMGTSFAVGGGDFRSINTRPTVARCWNCPGVSGFAAVALVYPTVQGTLAQPPLNAGLTPGVNVDFANSESAALPHVSKGPLELAFNLSRQTYWGNAIMYALTIQNGTARPATDKCDGSTHPTFINGQEHAPFKNFRWTDSSGQEFLSCFWLIYDFHRLQAGTHYNNHQDPGSLAFSVTHAAFPPDWEAEGDGAGYTLQGLQNFAGNHSEFLGCSIAGNSQASYCFGNLNTTGFVLPGLANEARFIVCTVEGNATASAAGDGTFTTTAGNFKALPGVNIFESTSGIANISESQTGLPTPGSDFCLGVGSERVFANITLTAQQSKIYRFTMNRQGYHETFWNVTGLQEGDYILFAALNRTNNRFHFAEACSLLSDGTTICRVLPVASASFNCDLFSFTANACFTFSSTTSGLLKRWFFTCPTDGANSELIGTVTVADAISGVTITTSPVTTTVTTKPVWQDIAGWLQHWTVKVLTVGGQFFQGLLPFQNPIAAAVQAAGAAAEAQPPSVTSTSCPPAGTNLMQSASPQLTFSKPGFRSLTFTPNEAAEDVVVFAELRTGTGSSAAVIVSTQNTTITDLSSTLGPRPRNVTTLFIRDSNATSGAGGLPGLAGGNAGADSILAGPGLNNFASAFGADEGSRALIGVLIFIPLLLGIWGAAAQWGGGMNPNAVAAIAGTAGLFVMGYGGFWPFWLQAIVAVAILGFAALRLRSFVQNGASDSSAPLPEVKGDD